jgi:acylphosphatase
MDICLHATVEGRVQGVGFRYFVVECAIQLGVSGWVRNLEDGTVEVVAEGERAPLNMLVEQLRQGPRGAYVTDLKTSWEPASGEFTRFDVRPSAWIK